METTSIVKNTFNLSSFLKSSENEKIIGNRLYADLKDMNGKFNRDYLIIEDDAIKKDRIDNINGYFRTNRSILPKNIFQTHESFERVERYEDLKMGVKRWKSFGGFKYSFYDNGMCERFIQENFERDVYDAYVKCPLGVMKADLWRYCIIFKYGGIYADVDTFCKVDDPSILLKNKAQLVVVPENEVHLCQWVFAAPAGSLILKKVIDISVERILRETDFKSYDHIVHKLTGPGVFTEGVEMFLKEKNLPTFSNKLNYFDYPDDILYCLDYNHFHKNGVVHFFSGQRSDGWVNERKRILY
jgi:mannosyltransferase OCH1-like enzyme